MKITISGMPGSGKSTIAKEVAKRLGLKHYSAGDFQRELAKEHRMSIEEWGEKEKKDKKYDLMVDEKTKEFGKKENNFVMDGWISAHFIPDSIKIFLDVNIDEAVRRRLNHRRKEESFETAEQARKSLVNREETNRKRWLEFYHYDYSDKKNYDIYLDTTNLNIREVTGKVLEEITKWNKKD